MRRSYRKWALSPSDSGLISSAALSAKAQGGPAQPGSIQVSGSAVVTGTPDVAYITWV